MAAYRIEFKRSAEKDLRKLPVEVLRKTMEAIQALAVDPFPDGCKKLQGSQYSYRTRIGDYRVVYSVLNTILTILIIRVRHRKDIYRNL